MQTWMRRVAMMAACLLAAWCGEPNAAAAAEPVSFPSVGPFASVTLTGAFYQAAGTRAPAVVLLHTCGGISPHEYAWADWFVSKGYSALVVDSFRPRGVSNLCGRRGAAPTPTDRAFDALGALAWLRSRPDVDPSRIAAIGWSHGGGTAVAVDAGGLVASVHLAGGGFRAVAALYPMCRGLRIDALAAPQLLLMGEADAWTPPQFCTELLASLPSGGPAVTSYTYPGATHEFDNPRAHGNIQINGRWVPLSYSAQDAADAHERVLAFFAAEMH